MIQQNAWLEIRDIPRDTFPEFALWVRAFFETTAPSLGSLCKQIKYDPSYLACWTKYMEYAEDDGTIRNRCTVYANPSVFEPLLRRLVMDLASAFPETDFWGSFRLLNSNWGFSAYPFSAVRGSLTWEEEIIARQQPAARRFWDAMQSASCATIRDLLEAMYAPMAGAQRMAAFFVLNDLFFDPEQEVSPMESYDLDEEGNPDPDSLVEFTYMSFLSHCWVDYEDIWTFFRALKEKFAEKNVPFDFPSGFPADS